MGATLFEVTKEASPTQCCCVVGIDPSLSSTAVAVATSTFTVRHFKTQPVPPNGPRERIQRYRRIIASIMGMIDGEPDLVLIEGYAMGYGKGRSAASFDRAEFGGVLRNALFKFACPIWEVPPATLKMFATGKGNADKVAVAVGIAKRYGVELANDDEYDAFACAALGAIAASLQAPRTAFERKAVAKAIELNTQR